MAATDIWLCPQTHNPTDIDLRLVGTCGAVAAVPSPGGIRHIRRRRGGRARRRVFLAISVTVTGRGAVRAAAAAAAETDISSVGRGTVRAFTITETHSAIAHTASATFTSTAATVRLRPRTAYPPALRQRGHVRLTDPDEAFLFDLTGIPGGT